MAFPGSGKNKAPSTKDQIRSLKKMLENVQMANRVLQIGMQQLSQSFQRVDADISKTMGSLNNMEYRTLAMLETGTFDKDAVDAEAEKLKTADYEKASAEEDEKDGLIPADEIVADSVVTVTSDCAENPDKSIFRSRFKLDESGNNDAMEILPGKKVGDKVELKINNDLHVLEVLAIRKKAPVQEGPTVEAAAANDGN